MVRKKFGVGRLTLLPSPVSDVLLILTWPRELPALPLLPLLLPSPLSDAPFWLAPSDLRLPWRSIPKLIWADRLLPTSASSWPPLAAGRSANVTPILKRPADPCMHMNVVQG